MSSRYIGIRREEKSDQERRAPLTPDDVRELSEQHGITFVVQPSPNRIFPDTAYAEAGAELSENLGDCDLIICIKEVSLPSLIPGKPHLFFSHTVKGQSYNMPMLAKILMDRITLIDYELIADDEGRRLIAFSYQAGQAGMINSLWSLGQRLLVKSIETPLARLKQAHNYGGGLDLPRGELRKAGEEIRANGLPEEISPLIIAVTGEGRVAGGAHDLLSELKPVELSPEELLDPEKRASLNNREVYSVSLHMEHYLEKTDSPGEFEFQDYIAHPDQYRARMVEYLPHVTLLVNGIYWDEQYPKLVTLEMLHDLYEAGNPKLQAIGDVTCDVNGSVESTVKATLPDDPVYVFNPLDETVRDGFLGDGLLMMSVDILPAEIPMVSSTHFGTLLKDYLPGLLETDFSVAYDNLDLPSELKRAVIAHQGVLAPGFSYLKDALEEYML